MPAQSDYRRLGSPRPGSYEWPLRADGLPRLRRLLTSLGEAAAVTTLSNAAIGTHATIGTTAAATVTPSRRTDEGDSRDSTDLSARRSWHGRARVGRAELPVGMGRRLHIPLCVGCIDAVNLEYLEYLEDGKDGNNPEDVHQANNIPVAQRRSEKTTVTDDDVTKTSAGETRNASSEERNHFSVLSSSRAGSRDGAVALFTFDELCGRDTGAADFGALARAFPTLLLADVPVLALADHNRARRFVTLIDEL